VPLTTRFQPPGATAWFAFETGDRPVLRTLATSRSAAPNDRALAISYLEELGEENATFVDAQFQKLLRETNFVGGTYDIYANILNVQVDKAGDFSIYTLRLIQDHRPLEKP